MTSWPFFLCTKQTYTIRIIHMMHCIIAGNHSGNVSWLWLNLLNQYASNKDRDYSYKINLPSSTCGQWQQEALIIYSLVSNMWHGLHSMGNRLIFIPKLYYLAWYLTVYNIYQLHIKPRPQHSGESFNFERFTYTMYSGTCEGCISGSCPTVPMSVPVR